jgi:Ca2+-binding EF-hand superfamily protein
MQETEHLVKELRTKMVNVVRSTLREQQRQAGQRPISEEEDLTDAQRSSFITVLFNEIDVDGSGNIDKDEFRKLLRVLKLTYR